MDPKDLKRILDSIKESDVNEFSLETPDYKLHVKRGAEVVHVAGTDQVCTFGGRACVGARERQMVRCLRYA